MHVCARKNWKRKVSRKEDTTQSFSAKQSKSVMFLDTIPPHVHSDPRRNWNMQVGFLQLLAAKSATGRRHRRKTNQPFTYYWLCFTLNATNFFHKYPEHNRFAWSPIVRYSECDLILEKQIFVNVSVNGTMIFFFGDQLSVTFYMRRSKFWSDEYC